MTRSAEDVTQEATDYCNEYLYKGFPLPEDTPVDVRIRIYDEFRESTDIADPLARVLTGLEVYYGAGRQKI